MESSTGRSVWMSVNTLMTKDVVSLKASSKVGEAWVLIMEADVAEAPVLDDSGKIVGVLSVKDIFRSILERYQKARSLSELTHQLTDRSAIEKEEIRELSLVIRGVADNAVQAILPKGQKILSVNAEDSIERAIHIMAEHSVNMLPVLKESRVVGVVTRQDIIWLIAGRPGKTHS